MKKRVLKILKYISFTIVLLTLLSCYSNLVWQIAKGNISLGKFNNIVNTYLTFPNLVKKVLTSKEIKGVSLNYVERDDKFEELNNLKKDIYGLNAFDLPEEKAWAIRLFNFKNDKVIREWKLYWSSVELKYKNSSKTVVRNPVLLKDSSIICYYDATGDIFRLSKDNSVVWHRSFKNIAFHHAINVAPDGNVWVCTYDYSYPNKRQFYSIDHITKLNIDDGSLMIHKSVTEIFEENNFLSIIHGENNSHSHSAGDILHTNDIEPVYSTTDYWKVGDVFLSVRNKSCIVLYRPNTNEVIEILRGPFLCQHDVDIYSNHEVTLFNNNKSHVIQNGGYNKFNKGYSGILKYDFTTQKYTNLFSHHFINEKIYTSFEGCHSFIDSNLVYVESQESGRLYIFDSTTIHYKSFLETDKEEYVERPNWIRVYGKTN